MANKSAYDISNELLVDAFKTAAIAAGAAHVSVSLGPVLHMNYLAGVLLARLEGVRPPMDKTDVVRLRKPRGEIGTGKRTVDRIHYCGNGHWLLSLVNEKGQYPAEQFKLSKTS